MVPDHLQPLHLLGRELFPDVLMLRHPVREPRLHPVGERHQLVLLVEGEAEDRDDVGEDALPGSPANLVAVERLVRPPEPVGRPVARGRFDLLGEILDVAIADPRPVGLRVEDLKGRDVVLVLLEVFLEVLHHLPGPLRRLG